MVSFLYSGRNQICRALQKKCCACHRMEEKCIINSTSQRLPRQRYSQQAEQQCLPMCQNQTIIYAIAMLVIATLVGANGLEQLVYIGLSDGDFGIGIVAGLSMAIIAIIADRMTQGWSKNRLAELGLDVQ